MLFKEIMAVYSDNHTKSTNTKIQCQQIKITGAYKLPLGFKRLKVESP
jgi:hypothetical protein